MYPGRQGEKALWSDLSAGSHVLSCRWVQGECRSIGEFDAPEVDGALQAAVGALRERPVLFKYCAEEVATARHNALFQVRDGRVLAVRTVLFQIQKKTVPFSFVLLDMRSSFWPRSASSRR
jgi:hypothetical protein